MAFEPFKITVAGEPAVWIGSGEKAWKEQVFAVSRRNLEELAGSRLIREDCAVELSFYLSGARLYLVDLDNLLKPAIDGLGTAIFPRGRTGQPYDSEDIWIRRLIARKLVDDRNPRLEITVTPFKEPSR